MKFGVIEFSLLNYRTNSGFRLLPSGVGSELKLKFEKITEEHDRNDVDSSLSNVSSNADSIVLALSGLVIVLSLRLFFVSIGV